MAEKEKIDIFDTKFKINLIEHYFVKVFDGKLNILVPKN